jgi:hypothetical protein
LLLQPLQARAQEPELRGVLALVEPAHLALLVDRLDAGAVRDAQPDRLRGIALDRREEARADPPAISPVAGQEQPALRIGAEGLRVFASTAGVSKPRRR